MKLLILEDFSEDSDLIIATLKRAGLHFKINTVSTRKDFIEALTFFTPEIILSDHRLPQFSSVQALEIAREMLPYIPFILVTGTISDEFAASVINAGADDYVLKSNLKRLPTAIQQAILKKKTEKAQAILVSIINSSDDAIISKTLDGVITSWNRGAERLFGYPEKEVLGMNISILIPPGQFNEETEIMSNIKRGEPIANYRTQRRKRNGEIVHISLTVSPIKDTRGNIVGASKIARNITERIEGERQKEFDRNNLSALINNTRDLMWSVDRKLKLITFNYSFNKVMELMSGKPLVKGGDILSTQFTGDQLNRYSIFYQRALSGESFTIIDHFDGPVEVWAEISFNPIRQGDEVIGTACFSHDITERKLAELERIKITNDLIQRNKDLEQFTYIVSHNLRAPVANIIGAASALNYPGLSAEKKDLLTKGLTQSVIKLDDVVKDLNHILQVKRETNQEKEKVNFSKLVDDIKISIQNLIDENNIEINYDFSEIDECLTLKSYFYSIFYNLISNSIKYRQPNVPAIIEINSHKAKDAIELIFTDNGSGIDLTKRRGQVFGLYKRFHSNIEGKGMGLFMVKTQVESLGGKISIQSDINKGTEFKIELGYELCL